MPSSSSSSSSASCPASPPEQTLSPPRPFFFKPPSSSDQESMPARPQLQPQDSQSGHLRPQDRQGSTLSIPPSGATTPANPFSTPTIEATNPFSPPASVISFSLGDAAATGFGDAQQGISVHTSLTNSAVDLQQRHSVTPREAFSSPRPRLT